MVFEPRLQVVSPMTGVSGAHGTPIRITTTPLGANVIKASNVQQQQNFNPAALNQTATTTIVLPVMNVRQPLVRS